MSITLTVAEIYSLAMFAGMMVEKPADDDAETEFTILDCSKEGVEDDDGKMAHFRFVAYATEYPEEGCAPLGPEIE